MYDIVKCKNCKWSRKAENKDYVGCAATLANDKIDYTNNDDLFNFYDRNEVATGWVNLHCYPDGTSWLGMITNGIPCFKPDDSCKHFELRGDYMDYKIYCDGAATMRKVNGEYVREAGGWAYALLDGNDKEICGAYGGKEKSSNNAMELTAIRNGLRRFLTFGETGKSVEVYSDSAYCINIFTSWIAGWKANGWTRGKKHEPIENVEIIKEIDTILEGIKRRFCSVTFVKVRGHAGDKWNEVCDKLAVRGKTEDACHGIEIELFPVMNEKPCIAADLMPTEW